MTKAHGLETNEAEVTEKRPAHWRLIQLQEKISVTDQPQIVILMYKKLLYISKTDERILKMEKHVEAHYK